MGNLVNFLHLCLLHSLYCFEYKWFNQVRPITQFLSLLFWGKESKLCLKSHDLWLLKKGFLPAALVKFYTCLSGFRWTLSPPNKRSISIHLYHESPLTLVVWLAPRLPPNGGKWFSLNRQSQTSTWRSGVPALGTDLATWSQNTTMQVSLLAYFLLCSLFISW